MGIAVGLRFLRAGAVRVDILQMARDAAHGAVLDILHGGNDGVVAGVGFRRGGQQDGRLCQGEPCLRQAQLHRRIHAGFRHHNGLRISKADILTGNDQQAAAGGQQIACHQQAAQIVHRRVRVGAADGLLQRRQQVVVLVAVTVIPHGAALGQL